MDTTHDEPALESGTGGGADAGSDATRPATTDVQAEIARAELFIAADGSYVETTSAHAARELKRRYDTLLGVGKGPFQRSPYAITAVMVHGRTMFRISRKEDDADVLPDTARRTSTATLHSPSGTISPPVGPAAAKHRKSRLSVSALLPSRGRDKERDRVSSYGHSTQHGHDDEGPRKLRKVRSGGELAQHQQQQAHHDPYSYYASHGTPSESELTGGGGNREGAFPYLHVSVGSLDPFADVVGVGSAGTAVGYTARGTTRNGRARQDSAASGLSVGGPSYFDPSASFIASSYGDSPSTHASGGDGEIAPFGPGVRFIPPVNPALAKTKKLNRMRSGLSSSSESESASSGEERKRTRKISGDKSKSKHKSKSRSRVNSATGQGDAVEGRGRPIRVMASFESGRTARRASGSPPSPTRGASPGAIGRRRASTMPSLEVSTWLTNTSTNITTAPTSVDIVPLTPSPFPLRSDEGDTGNDADLPPRASTPSASSETGSDSDSGSSLASLIPLATGHHIPPNSSSVIFDVLQSYSGLPRPSRLSAKSALETVRMSAAEAPDPKDDPRFVLYGTVGAARGPYTSDDPNEEPHKIMLAATIERWVASLTSSLDYDALLDFFLTYRSYVTAGSLLGIFKERFAWTLDQPNSAARRVVRVRTFLAIRYWMVTFFRVDFLRDEPLRRDVAAWVNGLALDLKVRNAPDAMSIVRKLKKLIMECKSLYSVPDLTSPVTASAVSISTGQTHTPSAIASPPQVTSPPAAARGNPFDEPNLTVPLPPSSEVSSTSSPVEPTPPPARPTSTLGDLSNAASFAASIQKAAEMSLSMSRPTTIESSDVDLDLGPLDALEWTSAHIGGFAAPDGFGAAFAASERAARTRGGSIGGPTLGGASMSAVTGGQMSMAGRQSAPQAAMSHLLLSGALLGPHGAAGAATSPNPAGPSSQPVAGMERRSSGVSRALVNTLGKIGRWKRAFSATAIGAPNSASGTLSPPIQASAPPLMEARSPPKLIGETRRQPHAHVQSYGREREVLVVNGGVAEYLRLLGGGPAPAPEPEPSAVKEEHREEVVGWDEPPRASEVFEAGEVSAREAQHDQDVTIKQPRPANAPTTAEEAPMHEPELQSVDFDRRAPRESFASESSYGSLLPPGLSKARQLFVGDGIREEDEVELLRPTTATTATTDMSESELFTSLPGKGLLPPGLESLQEPQLPPGLNASATVEPSHSPGLDADDAEGPILPPGLGGIQFTHPDPFASANNSTNSPTTPAASAGVSDPLAFARPVTPSTRNTMEGSTTPNARTPQLSQIAASHDAIRHSVASISSIASESSYGEEFVSRRLLPPGLSFSTAYGPAAGVSSSFNTHGTYNISGSRLPDLVHDDVEVSDQASFSSLEDERPAAQVDVVQPDELSDSDADSITGAPGQRLNHPAARRLPRRRDFDLVRHSASVSSMHTRSSRATSEDLSAPRNSQGETGFVIGGPVQQWQLDMINEHLSDDEDGGDAEFALRRLEGRIDADRQRAKLRKVDGWLAAIQKRMVEGSPDSDGDDDEERARKQRRSEEEEERDDAEEARRAGESLVVEGLPDDSLIGATTPTGIPTGSSPLIPTDTTTTLTEPPTASLSSLPQPDPPAVALTPITPTPPQIPQQDSSSRRPSISRAPGQSMSVHQSFVLLHKSEAIAHHLASVDRELFIAVRFEEIVSHDWEHLGQGLDMPGENEEQVNPTDWAAFMRSRRTLGRKASDVLAVKARFNIVVAWVASEISLSHANQRAAVAGKFIRIAWKSYLLNNYAAVVGIMAGLQCQWTHRAMGKAWSKVGTWELRVFDDLRAFTSREGNFRFVREATREASVENKSCVPFIGIYLAQLHDLSHLPDFVDPTSPTSPVTLVSLTPSTLSPSAPRLPEIFANLAPLPPSVALEPLVNIHKQRRIAGVIKALVAGQHLADAVRPPALEVEPSKASADRRLLQRCVRLKALDDRGFVHALNLPS